MEETKTRGKKVLASDADFDKSAKTTGEILKQQEKVKVKIYLDPEEKKKLESAIANGKKVEWPFEYVNINGYSYQIHKGKEVEVPLSVKAVLENAGLI